MSLVRKQLHVQSSGYIVTSDYRIESDTHQFFVRKGRHGIAFELPFFIAEAEMPKYFRHALRDAIIKLNTTAVMEGRTS